MAEAALPSRPRGIEELEALEIPKVNLAGLMKHFGPGVILMMTGIGTSHLITAPVAGARFGYALLWCIPVAYLFKYYGFEMAFRFTHATGKSLLDAYSTAWKKWPLWYVLITTLFQCALGQAGRLVAASAVLFYFFSQFMGLQLSLSLYGFLLGTLSVGILFSGKYLAVELVAKISAGVLCLSAVAIYLVEPAPLSSLAHFFQFETPAGSWLIVAGFLGLLPTGIDVSLQASEWGKAKKAGMARIREHLEEMGLARSFNPLTSSKRDLAVDTLRLPPRARHYCRRWFIIGLWDFRHGHVISFLIACIFLLLAAVWIPGSEVKGREVIGQIAKIFTQASPWMMPLFLLGSFAATYSTAFNYFDGWPRVVGACCRNLFRSTALLGTSTEDLTPKQKRTWYSEYNIYRMTMLFSLFAAVAIIAGAPRPVWLVLVASALAFFVAPVIFFLNLYYCFAVIPKEDRLFYPSRIETWLAWGSLAVFTSLSALLIMARIFRVALF
ncbi:MAG: Nramp family divalent metal transporter [Acidobacteriota bacterium]